MYAGEELKQTLTIAIFFYNLHTYTTRLANQNYVQFTQVYLDNIGFAGRLAILPDTALGVHCP